MNEYGNCVVPIIKNRDAWTWADWETPFHILTYNMRLSEKALFEQNPDFQGFKEWWFECKPMGGETRLCWFARG